MKSNLAVRDTSASTMQSVKGAFKANSKAFQFVLSGIYSNKPESITREIWTNAWDAHKEAGNLDKPFNVVFPGPLDPTFRVRDFGTGLSHQFMMERYPVIFDSTKDQDNNAVGKWGAGRMAPFSYVDSFSVTSYYNGTAGFYTVYRPSDGGIEVAHMGSQATTEPNGVEISFPIDKKDIPEFRKSATKVALGFDVKPKIINGRDFEWPNYDIALSGKRWRIYKSLPYVSPYRKEYQEQYVPKGPHARMGCVLYPIDKNSLGSFSNELLRKDIVIDFEIGDLEITASREDLSYGVNEPTKDSIVKALQEIEKDLLEEVKVKIKGARSVFEVLSFSKEARSLSSSNTFQDSVDSIEWGGSKVSELNLKNNFPFTMVENTYRRKYPSLTQYQHFHTNLPVQVYLVSIEKKNKDVRVRERIAIHSNERYRYHNKVVVYYESSSDLDVKLKEVDYWLKSDNIEYIYVKDIHDPGRTNTKTNRKVHVKSIKNNGFLDDIVLSDVEMCKGGVYLPITNNEIPIDDIYKLGFTANLSNINNIVSAINSFSDNFVNLVAVPKTRQKSFEESDKWTTVYDFVQKFVEKHYQIIVTTWYYNCYRREVRANFTSESYKVLPNFPKFNYPWSEALLTCALSLHDAVSKFKPDYSPQVNVPDISKYREDLKEKYPMLFETSGRYNATREYQQSGLIKDYINLVNKGN